MTACEPLNSRTVTSSEILDKVTLNISHELRTPLTAIQVVLDLLGSGSLGVLSDKGQRMVEIAANNTDRLLQLTAVIEQHPDFLMGLLSPDRLTQLWMESELELALARSELRLCYQPIVSLKTTQLTGFEALLRWQHPTLGTIAPAQFIPLAEATGLILEIGAWVLHEACSQFRIWQQCFPETFNSLTMSVNLSAKQLSSPLLVQQIQQVLQDKGLSARHLSLEVTESAVIEDTDTAKAVLSELRALGIQICVDDFGTGYSCLSRLYELPLDVLKLDRSFISQMDFADGEKLVRAIVNLAQTLQIEVIAEGVETAEQVVKLKLLDCDKGQGYFFSEPLHSGAVIMLLHGEFEGARMGKEESNIVEYT
jgi:c-di-GMP phosphodiesterase